MIFVYYYYNIMNIVECINYKQTNYDNSIPLYYIQQYSTKR